jgi:small nuclear ribonucleoprotein (snRNP)-like protein
MNFWRRSLAIGLAVCLAHVSLADVALSFDTAMVPNAALTRQQVDLLGVGARVKVQLANGKKLRGSISGIEDGAFLLVPGRGGSSARVAYEQVAQVKFARPTYKVAAQPDAAEARRVAVGLGVGKHIVVKTLAGKEYHGNIEAIDVDHFTIMPDGQIVPVQLGYTDLVQLGPNLSKASKIAIVVVVAVVAAYLIWFAAYGPR